MPSTTYDVDQYTDEELYQLLDINHPTDKELEARIHQMLSKYSENIGIDDDAQPLYDFFLRVYHRFFELPDEEPNTPNIGIEGFVSDTKPKRSTDPKPKPNPDISFNVGQADSTTKAATQPQLGYTKTVDYPSGSLNPLLTETIRRVISIDSQYRDQSVYPYSTDFTFNLSDVLQDVVSLKLYSVQIPYNWQTINQSFGGNFFILRANTPGLNNGFNDYVVDISSGNYDAYSLVTNINKSFLTLSQSNTDVSFGTTKIDYNPIQANATFTFDIKNNFNETYYYLYFPYVTLPTTVGTPIINSLPELFGYAKDTYIPCSIESLRYGNSTATCNVYAANAGTNYKNNTLTVYNYLGPDPYVDGSSTRLDTIEITLSVAGEQLPIETVITDINVQLKNALKLRNSVLEEIDTSYIEYGTKKYRMTLCQNRKKVANQVNSKMVAVFPAGDASNSQPLWVGPTSNFKFPLPIMEVNDIVSELSSQTTNYVIQTPLPKWLYYCINPLYATGVDHTRISDASFSVAASTTSGYSLTQYFTAIQTGMNLLSPYFQSTISNTTNVNNYIDVSINIRNVIPFQYTSPITGIDTLNNFALDISGSVLATICDFSGTILTNPTNGSTFTYQSSYLVTETNNTCYIVTYQGSNLIPTSTPVSIAPATYGSTGEFFSAINAAFRRTDLSNNFNMSSSSISGQVNTATSQVTCALYLNITAVLTNADYQVNLYDPSHNTWTTNLGLAQVDTLYASNGIAIGANGMITGNESVTDNDIILDSSNYFFYVKPISPTYPTYPTNPAVYDIYGGVYVGTTGPDPYANDILIDLSNAGGLSIGQKYTKTQIVDTINAIFAASPVTQGSEVDITTQAPYTLLRMNINKTYTTQDYQFVLYDRASFTHCNFGYPSSIQNATYDTTLGWLLGFRSNTTYDLTAESMKTGSLGNTIYLDTRNAYTYDSTTNIANITGDTSINNNLYNYFMIILDDYTQNHLNDGLVTVTSTDNDVPLPSYASRMNYKCDPETGKYSIADGTSSTAGSNRLTSKQTYAANQILAAKQNKISQSSNGPFVRDIFGLIPVKTSGLSYGASYVEFGGTLQIQERLYFGPVNIRRMSVKLLNDKGGVLDLNGVNWSFSLIAEQLYNPNAGKPTA